MIGFSTHRGRSYGGYGTIFEDASGMLKQLESSPSGTVGGTQPTNPAIPSDLEPLVESLVFWVGIPACILGFMKTSGLTSLALGGLGAGLVYMHVQGQLAPSASMQTLQKLTLSQSFKDYVSLSDRGDR